MRSEVSGRVWRWLVGLLALCAILAASQRPALANEAAPLVADPQLEARVMAIAEELRCLVCQNETIAASQAELAIDLKKQIRLKLTQGQSQRQILDFMVERYGDFVLYRPPLKTTTVLLWAGPFALLVLTGTLLAVHIRRRRAAAAAPLSDADAERARRLLSGDTPR